jgi:hypothetical protein
MLRLQSASIPIKRHRLDQALEPGFQLGLVLELRVEPGGATCVLVPPDPIRAARALAAPVDVPVALSSAVAIGVGKAALRVKERHGAALLA